MIDARMVFLARASAKHTLVINGEMGIDQAFEELEPAFGMISPCRCEREIYERLCRPPVRRPRGAA